MQILKIHDSHVTESLKERGIVIIRGRRAFSPGPMQIQSEIDETKFLEVDAKSVMVKPLRELDAHEAFAEGFREIDDAKRLVKRNNNITDESDNITIIRW